MLIGFSDTHRPELRLLCASLLLLALLATAVTQLAFVNALDLRGIHEMHETSGPRLTSAVFAISALGDTQTIVALAALAAAGLAAARHWHATLAVGLSIAVTELLVAVFKGAVERPRPPADQALTHAACAGLILGVGLSRVYLGVHYPTDIAAGWLVGAAIAAASWLAACLVGRALARPVSV